MDCATRGVLRMFCTANGAESCSASEEGANARPTTTRSVLRTGIIARAVLCVSPTSRRPRPADDPQDQGHVMARVRFGGA